MLGDSVFFTGVSLGPKKPRVGQFVPAFFYLVPKKRDKKRAPLPSLTQYNLQAKILKLKNEAKVN